MKYLNHNEFLKSAGLLALVVGMSAGFSAPGLAHDTTAAVPFNSTDAEEEGYWYSRFNLGNMAMRSGIGNIVMPNPQIIMKALTAADADFDPAEFAKGNTDYGDGDHAIPPKNVAPISTVYKSGDPHYITPFNPSDFGTQRWDPAKMDTTLTGLANGYAIMKEVEWARQFHVDDHFGTPDSNFGAYWRFVGAVMTLNAKLQARSFFADMTSYDLSNGGASVMLIAISDLSDLLGADFLAHSQVPNRFKDPEVSQAMAGGADKLFDIVNASNPTTIRQTALAIQSLVWYAAKTHNLDNKAQAVKKMAALTARLEAMSPGNATEQAYYLRGLIEAKRTIGINDGSIRAVGAEFLDGFNMDTGGFDNQNVYTIDDVGAIVGTLNALRIFETADVDSDQAEEVFKTFWEEVVNKGGLQLSTPPLQVAKSPFEYEGEPETYFRYGPSQPVPPKAGGPYGVAPVFATSIGYADGEWTVIDANFDSAGAMHASNEMIWFHYDEINGFPQVDLSDIL